MDDARPVVLLTQDARVRDMVESSAVTLGRPVRVLAEPSLALSAWSHAEVLLIGADLAPRVASAGPRRRAGVYLVGFPDADASAWSVPLGAEVIPLPGASGLLGEVLAGRSQASGRVVAVVGGSGGVGASTLAAALALEAASRGVASALMELDELSGGVDLLLGAERAPGWRWPRLVGARGEVGDVRSLLPRAGGVPFVAMARGEPGTLPGDAVVAVLGTLTRHHALVVVDAGRSPHPVARHTVRGADEALLVCGSDARGVAAAAATRARFEWGACSVVVRQQPGGASGPAVAEALGVPLAGVLPHEPRLARAAAEGEPPVAAGARWRRALGALTGALAGVSDAR